MCIATGVTIALALVGLIVVYYLHHQRSGEYNPGLRGPQDSANLASGRGNARSDNEIIESVEPIYDLVPSLKESNDEPNNQRPQPEGQEKRKVRFKNNI